MDTGALAGLSLLVSVFAHLQGGALVREGGAEEGGDDAHDDLGHVLLQDGVRVLPIAGVVAGLQHRAEQRQEQQLRLQFPISHCPGPSSSVTPLGLCISSPRQSKASAVPGLMCWHRARLGGGKKNHSVLEESKSRMGRTEV